ncbi:hypothetical protein Bbelb_120090 [Branchiostoma belcheri]|nr:hypothetical protein Bbelb_120090 [Branchiostoma belcheri]
MPDISVSPADLASPGQRGNSAGVAASRTGLFPEPHRTRQAWFYDPAVRTELIYMAVMRAKVLPALTLHACRIPACQSGYCLIDCDRRLCAESGTAWRRGAAVSAGIGDVTRGAAMSAGIGDVTRDAAVSVGIDDVTVSDMSDDHVHRTYYA